MEEAGIKFVGTTVPYENLKIRLNYSTRLAIATVANSLGYSKFEDALADKSVLQFSKTFMNEAKNGAGELPKDLNFSEYQKQFIERIGTKDLRYQTRKVLEDSSKRIRIDWQPVLDNLPEGAPTKAFGMTVAIWCHLISESPLVASEIFNPISDINSGAIQTYAVQAIDNGIGKDGEQVVARLLSNIFGSKFVDKNNINRNIQESLKLLQTHGIRGALDRMKA
jgi:mannitol-1-phosphate/altronate dehydrogenase